MPLFTYRTGPSKPEVTRSDGAEGSQDTRGSVEFAKGRILAGFALLVFVFGAGIYCAHDATMKDWSAPLLHTFELLLGGMVGVIVGEKTAAA